MAFSHIFGKTTNITKEMNWIRILTTNQCSDHCPRMISKEWKIVGNNYKKGGIHPWALIRSLLLHCEVNGRQHVRRIRLRDDVSLCLETTGFMTESTKGRLVSLLVSIWLWFSCFVFFLHIFVVFFYRLHLKYVL